MTSSFRSHSVIASLVIAAMGLVFASAVFADVVRFDRVPALDTHMWTVWTPQGRGTVEVTGDGDTDLDCYVFDRFERLLGKDERDGDRCTVRFRHASSGDITIFVRNRGIVYNEYLIKVR